MCECYLCHLPVDICLNEVKSQDFSLLLGNGILRAHPKGVLLDFASSEIPKKLESMVADYFTSNFDKECPESLLQFIRVELSYRIHEYYVNKFDEFKVGKLSKLRNYVQKFNNLFTLNYDPITYKSIFSENNQFQDGFTKSHDSQENEWYSLKNIEKNLKFPKGLYFLHGAFHLIYKYDHSADAKHLYKKVTAKGGSSLINEIIKEHKKNSEDWEMRPSQGFQDVESYEDALCVLESKSLYKKAWICNDPYLRMCYKRLGQQKKILSVGCSFKFDEHILERILKNPSLEHLWIGVFCEQDQQNICKAYKRIYESPMNESCKYWLEQNMEKVKFVSTKELRQIIWS